MFPPVLAEAQLAVQEEGVLGISFGGYEAAERNLLALGRKEMMVEYNK